MTVPGRNGARSDQSLPPSDARSEPGEQKDQDCGGLDLAAALEALLFVSSEPVSLETLAEVLEVSEAMVAAAGERLAQRYRPQSSGVELRRLAGGLQLCTVPTYAGLVNRMLNPKKPALSHAALETLAVIAYRQPATRAEVEQIRGVNCERSLHTLLERGLIVDAGRRSGPGRPILYGTSPKFLAHFGLESLEELPATELGKIPPQSTEQQSREDEVRQ